MTRSVNLRVKDHQREGVKVTGYKTIFDRSGDRYLRDKGMERLSLAFVLEAQGLLLCEIGNYRFHIMAEQDLVCVDGVNSFFNVESGALSTHYEPEHPGEVLYLISASPPKVTEFEISDFKNMYIRKIYMAQDSANRRFVAQPTMAVNNFQILLLMRDIFTHNYVIRVFSKGSTYFNLVEFDIELPSQS